MMTHQLCRSGTKMARSQSASRNPSGENNTQRRKSIAHVGERKFSVQATTLQVRNQRRASIRFEPSSKPTASPSCRSRSLKTPNERRTLSPNASNIEGDKTDPSRNFCYSLSVPGDGSEFHRLRNFSITAKGVVNRGDSFRCKSTSTSRSSSPMTPPADSSRVQVPELVPASDAEGGAAASTEPTPEQNNALCVPSSSSSDDRSIPRYRVWIMGFAGVGKTSLKLQFMTSEYICEMDNWRDENIEKNVTIVIDGEEFELEITECAPADEKKLLEQPLPDAFIIVYSVANRRSYLYTKQILSRLEPACGSKAVILVGNKTDLARLRTVETLEGRSIAKEWGCKFIETSVAINHQVDELLVGIITQIRIRSKTDGNKITNLPSRSRASKATGIIKRLWRKTCMTNKSCDNLHSV